MATFIRVDDFGSWIEDNLSDDEMLTLFGGIRHSNSNNAPTIPLLEIAGNRANTAKIVIPYEAPRPNIPGRKLDSATFSDGGDAWWNAWASILTATCLNTPVVDGVRLLDILHDPRRIWLCCDTNALCNGVAGWLLTILNQRADIFTSTVVNRELSAWPDKYNAKLWTAKSVEMWLRRTHFRLARRLIEYPIRGSVVEHLSPDQGALMLAKLRDESGYKSPDADMLLMELARGIIRNQPKNARVVYLTGDRVSARAATSTLGPDNVLFAVADGKEAAKHQNKIVARGWWHPGNPLGFINLPGLEQVLWTFLSACDFLILESRNGQYRIEVATSVQNGVPSDWADPWLKISEVSSGIRPSRNPEAVGVPTQETDVVDQPIISETEVTWLLKPYSNEPDIETPKGLRPTPAIFFGELGAVLFNKNLDNVRASTELKTEVRRLLVALQAVTEQGQPGEKSERFQQAWLENDLDWIHSQLMRLTSYRQVIQSIANGSNDKYQGRAAVNVQMARCLGQVCKSLTDESSLVLGDSPVTLNDLSKFLYDMFPNVGTIQSTMELSRTALSVLHLTPFRFERAMRVFFQVTSELNLESRHGGTIKAFGGEKVVQLKPDGEFELNDVMPAGLTFGSGNPVPFFERT